MKSKLKIKKVLSPFVLNIIRLFICIVILGAGSLPHAAKRFSVGPTADWDYSTINNALAAQVPFTEDVILEVYMDPSGYNTKGIVEYSNLFGGYSLYITGVTDFPKAATYYVNDELEYEVPQSKTGVCRTTEYVKGTETVARRVTQGASASGDQFYVKNHLGSTIFLTNAAATTNTDEADYFPYGKKIDLTTTPDHVTQTFTGKELDRYDEDIGEGEDGEGWYYFGARYYDADMGRWTSTDPKREFWDLFRYTTNPINYIDLNGLDELRIAVFASNLSQSWVTYYQNYLAPHVNEGDHLVVQKFTDVESMNSFLAEGDRGAIITHGALGRPGEPIQSIFDGAGGMIDFSEVDNGLGNVLGSRIRECFIDACHIDQNLVLPEGSMGWTHLRPGGEGTNDQSDMGKGAAHRLGIQTDFNGFRPSEQNQSQNQRQQRQR
jgi:RHS repeat-associated protein